MKLLEGKVAIVTGAARGIGKAIALRFAEQGANVAFTDLVINEAAEQTLAELEAFGVKAKAYASNAASFERWHKKRQWVRRFHGSFPESRVRRTLWIRSAPGRYPAARSATSCRSANLSDLYLPARFGCRSTSPVQSGRSVQA